MTFDEVLEVYSFHVKSIRKYFILYFVNIYIEGCASFENIELNGKKKFSDVLVAVQIMF